MRIRGKPSSFYSNSNVGICDGGGPNSLDGWSGGCIISFIDELLAEYHSDMDNEHLSYDDGSFEVEYNAGSSNYSATYYDATAGDMIESIRWYQTGVGGIL